ncbi:single-stranded DNA-binding protein [Verrucomicrobia bacterium LW23]|nr:single-stranded DNA-binding protein [Verrucomicrobia bacterium LW23]
MHLSPMSQTSARDILESILGHLGFPFQIEETKRGDCIVLNIISREAGRLIGRDGHTIEDLQYLVNRLLHGVEDSPQRVIVDVEGYRQKGEIDFIVNIREVADRVRATGEPELLPAMNSYDRRLVHQALAEDAEITTRSEEGNARMKQITIELRRSRQLGDAQAATPAAAGTTSTAGGGEEEGATTLSTE